MAFEAVWHAFCMTLDKTSAHLIYVSGGLSVLLCCGTTEEEL